MLIRVGLITQPTMIKNFIQSAKTTVFSTYKKQRILHFASLGLKPPTIAKELEKEKLKCSRVSVYKFLKHYQATGSTGRRVGSGRPSKVMAEIKKIVEDQMRLDDETTAHQLHRLLTEKGYSVSLRTILTCHAGPLWAGPFEAACIVN